MSNMVYGFCNAGCRYRVPTYDEFKSIASYVKVLPEDDGTYKLDFERKYLIKNPSVTNAWGFTITVMVDGGSTRQLLDLITYDKYADGLKFRSLKLIASDLGGSIKYDTKFEQNGQIGDKYSIGTSLRVPYIEVKSTTSDELDIIMYNEDAEIQVKQTPLYRHRIKISHTNTNNVEECAVECDYYSSYEAPLTLNDVFNSLTDIGGYNFRGLFFNAGNHYLVYRLAVNESKLQFYYFKTVAENSVKYDLSSLVMSDTVTEV